jgi:hypothetical protein
MDSSMTIEATDGLEALVASALAREAGEAAGEAHLRQARARLSDYAFRHLHNHVEALRREAVAEHQARHPRAPGFWGVFAATLLASGLVAGGALAVTARPEWLEPLRLALGG